jgi:polysaccharide biosynthesis/export protein
MIGPDDLLAVNVWKEPEVSRNVLVRPDGKISLPLVGDLRAGGRTPVQLQDDIKGQLLNYLSNPEVTVIVQEARSQKFNILGEVEHPGSYPLNRSMTVLDAIAVAGGLRDFAKTRKIYVLRIKGDGLRARLPFNYKEVIKGRSLPQNIELQPRDTVVVP